MEIKKTGLGSFVDFLHAYGIVLRYIPKIFSKIRGFLIKYTKYLAVVVRSLC
jgi:hypothetical protein